MASTTARLMTACHVGGCACSALMAAAFAVTGSGRLTRRARHRRVMGMLPASIPKVKEANTATTLTCEARMSANRIDRTNTKNAAPPARDGGPGQHQPPGGL
jgi:hypothetical protein